jgi:hypothetical protein
VVGAKVVTNTRTPGQKCFGYVTMQTSKDATECIKNLNRSELHGRKINVERAKSDLGPKSKAESNLSSTSNDKLLKDDGKKNASTSGSNSSINKDSERKKSTDENKKDDSSKPERKRISPPARSKSKSRSREVSKKPSRDERRLPPMSSRGRAGRRSAIRSQLGNPNRRDVISLNKLREERERRRMREKELQMREDERKRRETLRRQRELEDDLAREREILAIERRKLEKQKAELLKIERERQKLERERIELERLELKKQQRKYGLIDTFKNFARFFFLLEKTHLKHNFSSFKYKKKTLTYNTNFKSLIFSCYLTNLVDISSLFFYDEKKNI